MRLRKQRRSGRNYKKNPNRAIKRPAQGRRTYGKRYLILRRIDHQTIEFTKETGTGSNPLDWEAVRIEQDQPGVWIPKADEVDKLKTCKWDNCDTKRLVSAHLYLKDIKWMEWYQLTAPRASTNETDLHVISRPHRNSMYTYHDGFTSNLATLEGHNIRNNGIRCPLPGNVGKYHTVWKSNFHCRRYENGKLEDMQPSTWKGKTIEYDMINRTDNDASDGTRYNADWNLFMEGSGITGPGQTDPTGSKTRGVVTFTRVFSTKWRLYGSKHQAPGPN